MEILNYCELYIFLKQVKRNFRDRVYLEKNKRVWELKWGEGERGRIKAFHFRFSASLIKFHSDLSAISCPEILFSRSLKIRFPLSRTTNFDSRFVLVRFILSRNLIIKKNYMKSKSQIYTLKERRGGKGVKTEEIKSWLLLKLWEREGIKR